MLLLPTVRNRRRARARTSRVRSVVAAAPGARWRSAKALDGAVASATKSERAPECGPLPPACHLAGHAVGRLGVADPMIVC